MCVCFSLRHLFLFILLKTITRGADDEYDINYTRRGQHQGHLLDYVHSQMQMVDTKAFIFSVFKTAS